MLCSLNRQNWIILILSRIWKTWGFSGKFSSLWKWTCIPNGHLRYWYPCVNHYHWTTTLKPPALCCAGSHSVAKTALSHQIHKTSGYLEIGSRSFCSCWFGVGPPWITLIPAHPTDARSDWERDLHKCQGPRFPRRTLCYNEMNFWKFRLGLRKDHILS